MKKLGIISLCIIFAVTLCGCKSGPKTPSSYLSYADIDASSINEVSSVQESSSNKPKTTQSSSSSKPEKSWESTVVAPYKVIFYKNGQAVESTDAEQNLKIAKHIESYFKGKEKIMRCKCAIMDSQIAVIRANETAVELFFDESFTFYNGVISERTRTLFIPLTGDKAGDLIQNNDDNNYDYASGPIKYSPKGLEQFFSAVLDTPEQLGPPEYCAAGNGYKGVWGRYYSTETAENHGLQGINDLYVFKNDDGVVIKQDVKTRQIVEVDYNIISAHAKEPLTEQKAIEAAKRMVTMLYDISKYDKYEVTKPFTTGVLVTVKATANDADVIQVRINEDASISKIVKGYDIIE